MRGSPRPFQHTASFLSPAPARGRVISQDKDNNIAQNSRPRHEVGRLRRHTQLTEGSRNGATAHGVRVRMTKPSVGLIPIRGYL